MAEPHIKMFVRIQRAHGPILGVRRIWVNGRLVFNRRAAMSAGRLADATAKKLSIASRRYA